MASRMLSIAAVSALVSSCATTPGEVHVDDSIFARNVNTTETDVNARPVGNTRSLAGDGVYFHSESIAAINEGGEREHSDWVGLGSGELRHGAVLEDELHQCSGLLQQDGQGYLSSYEDRSRSYQTEEIFPRGVLD